MVRNLVAAVALLAFIGSAVSQPDPKKPDDKTLVTKVYDIKLILGEKGKASGIADADAVIKLILETIPVGELKPGTDGPQLVERDGGKLEVRATAKTHEEIKDLIEALARLADVAVDVKAEVIELDPAAFEKLGKALPRPAKGAPKAPVLFATGEELDEKGPTPAEVKALEEANKILKAGKVVQTSTGRFTNGLEATLSARQSVLTYKPLPDVGAVAAKPQANGLFMKEGFKLAGVPIVSADRRFVRFKLTEQSAAVVGVRKREVGEVGGKPIVAESPELEDLGATGSAVVADGGTLLFKLAYAPKDKVWVVSLKPTIYIKAEDDEVKKQEKR